METVKIIFSMSKNLLLDFKAEWGSEISDKKLLGNLGLGAFTSVLVGNMFSTKHVRVIRGLGQTEIQRSDSVISYVNGKRPIRDVIRETLCTLQ